MIETHVGIGNPDVLRLRTVNGVSEDPSTRGTVRIHALFAVLALTAGADAGDYYAISLLVALQLKTKQWIEQELAKGNLTEAKSHQRCHQGFIA